MNFEYRISEWLYHSLRGIFKSILFLTYSVRSYGMENLRQIPAGQGFLLAANHGSIVDAFVMGLEVDSHRVRFVGKEETLWANPVFGKINDIVGTIPVPSSIASDRSKVIHISVDALKQGTCIGIFPEGAVRPWLKRYDGKSGTARIALEAGVPIVPMGLLGTDGLWPYGANMPRLGRQVKMYIGEPMYFDKYHGMQNDREVVQYVTDSVMQEIRRLSGWYDVPSREIIKYYERYENLVAPIR